MVFPGTMRFLYLMGLVLILFSISCFASNNYYASTAISKDNCEIAVWEGETVKPDFIISDPDRKEGYGPAGALILTYVSPLDAKGEWKTKEGDAGIYKSQITVDDGQYKDVLDFCIEVVRHNKPPVAEDIYTEIEVGETAIFNPKVSDSDSGKLYIRFAAPISKDGMFNAKAVELIETYYTVSDGESTTKGKITILVKQSPKSYVIIEKEKPKTQFEIIHTEHTEQPKIMSTQQYVAIKVWHGAYQQISTETTAEATTAGQTTYIIESKPNTDCID